MVAVGFRNALHNAGRFARNAYTRSMQVASHVDRGLGTAARLYRTVAPILAPLAQEMMGSQRARATDKAIRDAMSGYGNVRSKVMQVHRMGDTLASMVRKEIPSLQIK